MKKDGTITINGKNITAKGEDTVTINTKAKTINATGSYTLNGKENKVIGKNHITGGDTKIDGGNVYVN